jgi:hypothetical protein
MGDAALNEAMTELGAALGLRPRDTDTAAAFARRCTAAARMLRRSAGITWPDYVLIKAERGIASFGLREGADGSALGGPRWNLQRAQGLDILADQLGKYERA